VENVTGRRSNPFDFTFPCERAVPGFGDVYADFHVAGDHPGIHGGADSGVPFTDTPAARRLQDALVEGGLLRRAGSPPVLENTYLSYLHPCADAEPTSESYADLEPLFDSELRAITAHVLLPVGERPTRYVFDNMTARTPADLDIRALHATEVVGSGWLVYPILDPREWSAADGDRLARALQALRATDYRRTADLGRFLPGGDSYLVR
jgi:uracil-DNA glycosylase